MQTNEGSNKDFKQALDAFLMKLESRKTPELNKEQEVSRILGDLEKVLSKQDKTQNVQKTEEMGNKKQHLKLLAIYHETVRLLG